MRNSTLLHSLPVIAVAAAGLIHLVLAPSHAVHAPAHGIFFALAGVTEILWALAFWRRPSSRLYYLGLGLTGGLVVLWAITRFLMPPFEHEPGMFDLGGIVCKTSELAAILGLCAMALQGQIVGLPRPSLARTAGAALILALVMGISSYIAGLALEPVLPSLAGSAEHGHAAQSEAMHAGDEHTEDEHSGVSIHADDIEIQQPRAGVASEGGTGGVFMLIKNNGQHTDRLLSVESEAAEAVEIHETSMEADVMKMRKLDGGLEVPAGGQVELKHGGYHIMLINLAQTLKPGDRIELVLNFEEAGSVHVEAVVQAP